MDNVLTPEQVAKLVDGIERWEYKAQDMEGSGDARFVETLQGRLDHVGASIGVTLARCSYSADGLQREYGSFDHGIEVRLEDKRLLSPPEFAPHHEQGRVDSPDAYPLHSHEVVKDSPAKELVDRVFGNYYQAIFNRLDK